jgi:ubiquinone/menaquinone biosynthesis C-methylase UbiE
MIGKTDWTQYLHEIRRREIDIVFSLLPQTKFFMGLEIGAGDGYQTTLLAPRIERLVSSDLNFKRIKESLKVFGVSYKTIDADSIEGVFETKTFDFIFSSNVLEHLHDPYKFLAVTQPMLTDEGYAVHIIPSRHIKVFYLMFFYPHMVLLAFDRLLGKLKGQSFFKGADINLENNINIKTKPQKVTNKLKKFLMPSPHGNFPSHTLEFIAFGRRQWEQLFRRSGYSIVAYAPGPAFSGYGFGWPNFRKLLECCGVSSEHIFVLKKASSFESVARIYTNALLPKGSYYEKEKFIQDWMNKGGNAKAFIRDFTNNVGTPNGKKILDVGFGNGIMLLEFARAGAITYGLETDSSLLSLARKHFEDINMSSRFSVYDGKSFPFPDNTFDYIYSTSVLEHMSYPQKVLLEISRTLVPGGRFYLSFPNKYAPKESHTGLWFVSWLPRFLTQRILKYSKSSPLEDWNLHFISYFTLKKMAKKACLRIIYDTQSQSFIRRFVKKILASCGVHYGVLLKTIILVLEKPGKL